MTFLGETVEERLRRRADERSPSATEAACRSTTGCTTRRGQLAGLRPQHRRHQPAWRTTGPSSTRSSGPPRTRISWRGSSRNKAEFSAPAAAPASGTAGGDRGRGDAGLAPPSLSLTAGSCSAVVRIVLRPPGADGPRGPPVAALGVGYAAHSLTLETSKFHLLPLHQPYATLYKDYAEDFGQLEDIVVVVREPDRRDLHGLRGPPGGRPARRRPRDGARQLSGRRHPPRSACPAVPAARHAAGHPRHRRQPGRAARRLRRHADARSAGGRHQPVHRRDLPARRLRPRRPGGCEPGSHPPAPRPPDPDVGADRRPTVPVALGEPVRRPDSVAPDGGYFLSHDRRLLFVVDRSRERAAHLRRRARGHPSPSGRRSPICGREFPTVEAGVTGAPALFSDELSAATRDGEIASVLAMVLTLALLLLAFRRLSTSCAMLAVLALSLGWSLGVITLLVGQLTIFSMMFVSVVIGLGIDYGIFFLFRYREERVLGRTLVGALERTAARERPRHPARCPHRGRDLLHPDHRRVPRHPRFRLHLRHRDPARVRVDGDRLPGRPAADRPLAEGPPAGAERRSGRRSRAGRRARRRASCAARPGAGVARALSEDDRRRLGPRDRSVAVGRAPGGLRLQPVEPPGRRTPSRSSGSGRPPPPRDARCSPRSRRRPRSRSSRPSRPRSGACPPSRTCRACCRCCPIDRPRSCRSCSASPTWRTASSRAPPRPLDLRALTVALETLKRRLDLASAPRGGTGPPEEILVIARATSALLDEAQGARARRRRDRARRLPGAAGRGFRPAVAAASARRPAGAAHARRPARRAAATVHRQERAAAPPGLLAARPLGPPQPGALRGGAADRRPGRHRTAGRRVRVDAAHRERRSAWAGVRLRPRRRDRRAHDPPGAGDRARDGAR